MDDTTENTQTAEVVEPTMEEALRAAKLKEELNERELEQAFFERGEKLDRAVEMMSQQADAYRERMENQDQQFTQALETTFARRRKEAAVFAKEAQQEYRARVDAATTAAKGEYKDLRNLLDMVGTFKTTKDAAETPKQAPAEKKPKVRPKSAYEGRTDISKEMIAVGMALEKRRADLDDKLADAAPFSVEQEELLAADKQLRYDLSSLERDGEKAVAVLAAKEAARKEMELTPEERAAQKEAQSVTRQEQLTALEKGIKERGERIDQLTEQQSKNLETEKAARMALTAAEKKHRLAVETAKRPAGERTLEDNIEYKKILEKLAFEHLKKTDKELLEAYKPELSANGKLVAADADVETPSAPSDLLGVDFAEVAASAKEKFKRESPVEAKKYENGSTELTPEEAEKEVRKARFAFNEARDARRKMEKELTGLQEEQTKANSTRETLAAQIKKLEPQTASAVETPTKEPTHEEQPAKPTLAERIKTLLTPTETLSPLQRFKEQARLLDAVKGEVGEEDDIRTEWRKADLEAKAAEREVNTILQQYSEHISQMDTLKKMQDGGSPREKALAERILAEKRLIAPPIAPFLRKRYEELTGEKMTPKSVKRREPVAAIERWERADKQWEVEAHTMEIPKLLDQIEKLLERIDLSPDDQAAAYDYERLNAIAEKRMSI